MKTIAIHQNDDWYLVNLPGYSDIPRKHIKVDVSLALHRLNMSRSQRFHLQEKMTAQIGE